MHSAHISQFRREAHSSSEGFTGPADQRLRKGEPTVYRPRRAAAL